MEDAFGENENVKIKNLSIVFYKANKILKRLIHKEISIVGPNYSKNRNYLFVAMSLTCLQREQSFLKKLARTHDVALYCFDTWEANYSEWEHEFSEIKPQFVFLAYQAAVEYFSKKFSNIYFLPQSMDEKYFHPRSTIKKERLFMQMGRKNQKIHNMILSYLAKNGIPDVSQNYVYERIPKTIVFPDTDELAENICRSKYFVCAPQADENEALTGKCSDVTARFYEAISCKTLIIGFKPATFDMLFPSNAMVELKPDGSDFEEKIDFYESHPEVYNDLVNNNYDFLVHNHRWQNRYESVMRTIEP